MESIHVVLKQPCRKDWGVVAPRSTIMESKAAALEWRLALKPRHRRNLVGGRFLCFPQIYLVSSNILRILYSN